jgi:hypothetical protein
MSTLKIGDNLTLEMGDFIVISGNGSLDYGWYCGQGRYKNTLHYYSIWGPASALEDFERYEAGDKTGWRADKFIKHSGFTSKCFVKHYLNSYYESRILKPANPDELFTNQEHLQRYNKSKEALIKIKFLDK